MCASLWRKIRRMGRVAEPAPPMPAAERPAAAERLAGSVQLRHVDAGSCNGCEIEIGSAFGPVYDAGALRCPAGGLAAARRRAAGHRVGDPQHGRAAAPHLRRAARARGWWSPSATAPCDCGVFAGAYGVEGAVGDVVPVDLEVPGCPPRPEAIVAALRTLTGR